MTYLEKYMQEYKCSEEDFWVDQQDYDGLCPEDVGVYDGCPRCGMTCEECWKREVADV